GLFPQTQKVANPHSIPSKARGLSRELYLSFYHFQLEVNLFAPGDRVQVLLPEFANEPHRGKTVIQVNEELKPGKFPKIQHGHAASGLADRYVRVEGEDSAFMGEIAE